MKLFEFLAALFGTTDAPIDDAGRTAALAALSNEDLGAMRDQAIADIKAAAESDVTPAVVVQMKQALTVRNDIEALLAARALEVEQLATDVDAILADVGACGACEENGATATGTEGAADESTEGAEGAPAADGAAAAKPGFVPAVPGRKVTPAAMADAAGDTSGEQKRTAPLVGQLQVATDMVSGFEVGSNFESLIDVGRALASRWDDVKHRDQNERFTVATVKASIPEDRRLVEGDVHGNVEKMGGYTFLDDMLVNPDLAATICAPREPLYDLACQSSTARPVAGSLAGYGAPRGGVSVYPSPRLSDVDITNKGVGIWTRDDDADADAVKACTVIPCATPEDYDIYGIWRCLTIKNMNAMTFPELIAAFLNRLGALQAQLAETTLLNAMAASVNTIDVHAETKDVGASIAALETVLRTITFYKEQERYGDVRFKGWAHRHVRDMLIADVLLQRRTDNTSLSARMGAARDVDAAFADLGVDMTWTMDRQTSAPHVWPTMTALSNGGAIPEWPSTIKMLISPVGNFKRLDGGNLNIGVTPNNIYRDNNSNAANQFTMFWESFEGLVDFGCRNLHLNMTDVCVGGTQVADVVSECDAAQS